MENNILDTNPVPQQSAMRTVGRIVGINMLVTLGFSILLVLLDISPLNGQSGDVFGWGLLLLTGLQLLVNFMMGIVRFAQGNTYAGLGFILSIFVVLLVGVSACFGGMAVLF